jgi:hypothetical protein
MTAQRFFARFQVQYKDDGSVDGRDFYDRFNLGAGRQPSVYFEHALTLARQHIPASVLTPSRVEELRAAFLSAYSRGYLTGALTDIDARLAALVPRVAPAPQVQYEGTCGSVYSGASFYEGAAPRAVVIRQAFGADGRPINPPPADTATATGVQFRYTVLGVSADPTERTRDIRDFLSQHGAGNVSEANVQRYLLDGGRVFEPASGRTAEAEALIRARAVAGPPSARLCPASATFPTTLAPLN